MASSVYLVAKRAFVTILLSTACGCQPAFKINRDSNDQDILKAYRREWVELAEAEMKRAGFRRLAV